MNFTAALRNLVREAGGELGTGPDSPKTISPLTLDRPTKYQPPVQTDGLDPAAPGGPAPMNSGEGPYGQPVATDPELDAPIHPGSPVPYTPGPDVDTTVLN